MITFTQWAQNENKDLSFVGTIEEKQMRTVSAFPGSKGYPAQTGAPKGDDSLYPPQYYPPNSATGALSVEIGKKKGKKK